MECIGWHQRVRTFGKAKITGTRILNNILYGNVTKSFTAHQYGSNLLCLASLPPYFEILCNIL